MQPSAAPLHWLCHGTTWRLHSMKYSPSLCPGCVGLGLGTGTRIVQAPWGHVNMDSVRHPSQREGSTCQLQLPPPLPCTTHLQCTDGYSREYLNTNMNSCALFTTAKLDYSPAFVMGKDESAQPNMIHVITFTTIFLP